MLFSKMSSLNILSSCLFLSLFFLSQNVAFASAFNHKTTKKWSTKYDRHFKKYSKHYFGPLFDWRWFKAQAIAESGLSHKAKSPVGARGIMQIMPSTFKEISKKNPHFSELGNPKWNIAAGIYYNRKLYVKFKKSPVQDKLYMTFASYNAGYYRVFKATKRANHKKIMWIKIKKFLPKETRAYVKRIKNLMSSIVADNYI